MHAEIILPGRPITKKNSREMAVHPKSGKRFPIQSKQYRKYEKTCLEWLKLYNGPRFLGAFNLCVKYWMPDRSGWPDLLGLLQATADILQKGGIICNDKYLIRPDGSEIVGLDPLNPRAEITITALESQLLLDLGA